MTNNKQQTAVQWFLDQLIEHRIIVVDKTTYQVKYKHEILLEQAKEMEKERAIKFACDAHMNVKKDKVKSLMQLVDEKYNETYG
jgi:hypothetical protein